MTPTDPLQNPQEESSTLTSGGSSDISERKWIQSSWDLLIEYPDGQAPKRMPVCYSHMTIGSTKAPQGNDIYLCEAEIATRQALLKVIGENLYFNNLNKDFPIALNGELSSFACLRPGDKLSFGRHQITVMELPTAVAFLEGYTEPHRRQQWNLSQTRVCLGRAGLRHNQVELNDPTVSRKHASILRAEADYLIQADGDKAVWINGKRVATLQVLADEDIIQLGKQLLRFRNYRAKKKARDLARREATILFSDVWNYTSLAENHPLKQTIGQVNEMYKGLGRDIINNKGTLMTYLGDAMMAVFGSELEPSQVSSNHAELAVRAALGMLKTLEQLNDEWSHRGFPRLQMGIGIATGDVMLGDVGLSDHREFAAMGDTTNVASRIEKLTRTHGANIVISGATARGVEKAFKLRDLGTVRLKGRRQAVEIFQVLEEKSNQ